MSANMSGRVSLRIVVALVIAIAIGFVIFFFWPNNRQTDSGAVSVGDTFMQAVLTDDAATSYRLLGEPMLRHYPSETRWSQWIGLVLGEGVENSFELVSHAPLEQELRGGSYTDQDNPSVLKYRIVYEGNPYLLPLILSEKSGDWKIDEIGIFERQ